MSTVQPTDKVLVQRGTTQYSAPSDMSTVQDTDLILVNRAGIDYKCSIADWRASQGKAPVLYDTVVSDSPEAGRFTSATFSVTAHLAEPGTPPATLGIKAWVEGSLKSHPQTSGITSVTGNVLHFADVKDIDRFANGDHITEITPAGVAGDATGTVGSIDLAAKTITLSAKTGTWNTGNHAKGPAKLQVIESKTDTITKVTITGGTGWTAQHAASGDLWQSVCWSPQLKLLVAVGGKLSSSATQVMTSPDGKTWTAVAQGGSTGHTWQSVCWSPKLQLFAAVSVGGPDGFTVMTSPNGTTWTRPTVPGNASTAQFTRITWADGINKFVAIGAAPAVMTSPDGVTWTMGTIPAGNWKALCYSPELKLLVAVADGGANRVATSPDGITWTVRTVPKVCNWTAICWSPEQHQFVAVAQASSGFSDKVMTSPDGINWTVGTCPDQEWISICWSSEMSVYVAGATSGTGNRVMTSADGITWKTAVTPLDNAWRDFIWVSDLSLFVAVGQSSFYDQVLTSADGGATFTTLTFATDKGLSQFPKGVAITQDNNAASGFAGMTDSFAKTMVVSGSTGTWSANTGNYVKGPSTPIKTKLYCKLNAGLTVTDLQSPDPGYTAAAGTGPFTVTFPATLPSGNPPDTDLPAGTELTVEVQASNHAGTSTKHQTITPA